MGIKCKSLRANIHCQLPFRRPILDLTNLPSRFFSMTFDCLVGKIAVTASDFSVRAGNGLGDVSWKYNIFGGFTSVTMHPDRLAFDFPNLAPSEYPIARQVIESVHD